jgi:uncharacterized membrane protein
MHVPHWLEITLVALHVLGATVWVGGTIALTFIAVPAIRTLTGEARAATMRKLGERWRPIGWSALLAMVLTGAPLAAHVLPDSGAGAKAVFAVKMALFALVLVGWTSFTLTLSIPILGVVLAEIV